MNTTCCSNATRPDPYAPGDFQYTKFNRASVELRASAGISLVTADGDKVTLNASSSIQAGLQTYDYFGRTRGQTVAARGEELQLATSNGYAVTVEGKLDQAELADIRQLISTLSSVSKDFFAGNSQDGLQHLAQLDDLDSIASFKASFNYTRQVSAVAASQISSTAAAQAQETADATRAAATNSSQAADSFIDQLRRVADWLESDSNFENIPKRFIQLFKKLAHQLPLDTDDDKLAKRLHSEHSRHGRHIDRPTQQLT
jgi:hypothetical protein